MEAESWGLYNRTNHWGPDKSNSTSVQIKKRYLYNTLMVTPEATCFLRFYRRPWWLPWKWLFSSLFFLNNCQLLAKKQFYTFSGSKRYRKKPHLVSTNRTSHCFPKLIVSKAKISASSRYFQHFVKSPWRIPLIACKITSRPKT